MDIFAIYIAMFFIVFLVMPVMYFTLRFIFWFLLDYCGWSSLDRRNRESDQNHTEQNTRRRASHWGLFYDRQGNIFTISDETTGNTATNRYPDFFYLEPSSDEAARIRAQLEKDDKDLPSYDDVMRMTSLSTMPPTTSLASIPENATNTFSTSNLGPPPSPPDVTVPVPPYSEVDPNSAPTSHDAGFAASTSRGAAVTIPIGHSASNTSV